MEWISVEDRLPEVDQYVLVYAIERSSIVFKKEIPVRFFAVDCLKVWNDRKANGKKMFFVDRFSGKITHWMPLPKRPNHVQVFVDYEYPDFEGLADDTSSIMD